MTDPTGDSYTALMNGAEALVKAIGVTTVSVAKMGPRTLMEKDMRNGKIIEKGQIHRCAG